MCDYSLTSFASRPARVGERLRVINFGSGTRGFVAEGGDCRTAVCLLPGTELAFDGEIGVFGSPKRMPRLARFTQLNKHLPTTHHDTLEFADGTRVLLTFLMEDQIATVLQLPAAPRNEAEIEEQQRAEFVG